VHQRVPHDPDVERLAALLEREVEASVASCARILPDRDVSHPEAAVRSGARVRVDQGARPMRIEATQADPLARRWGMTAVIRDYASNDGTSTGSIEEAAVRGTGMASGPVSSSDAYAPCQIASSPAPALIAAKAKTTLTARGARAADPQFSHAWGAIARSVRAATSRPRPARRV